jgi:glutamyl-tRNA synthetase
VELGRALAVYAADPTAYDADGIRKQVRPETPRQLEALAAKLEAHEDWSVEALEATLRAAAEELGVGAGRLIHPVRLALTGITVGAPLFDVMALLGKETTLRRLRRFLEEIRSKTPA